MTIRYPRPLRAGDRVGVTSPSSGVDQALSARLNVAIDVLRGRGFEVVVGECMSGDGHVSAPAAERAAELMAMLTDPSIAAVIPPWGGELAIDLLPLLDFEKLRAAAPTWLVGFSDISTLLVPFTLLTGVASVHGNNLMDTPYQPPAGLLSWLDIVTSPAGSELSQTPPGRYRATGWVDYAVDPTASEFTLDAPGRWRRLDREGDVRLEGRLIGGCIETISNLTGSRYLDQSLLAGEELLVYVEASEADAYTICRNLHGMRMAGLLRPGRRHPGRADRCTGPADDDPA